VSQYEPWVVGVAAGIPSFLALVLAVILAVFCVLQWKNYSWTQVITFHLLGALLRPSLGLHLRNLIPHPVKLLGCSGPHPWALRRSLLCLSQAGTHLRSCSFFVLVLAVDVKVRGFPCVRRADRFWLF